MGPFAPLSPLSRSPPSTSAMNGLRENLQKAATVFPSHVRRSFSRRPTDFTGDLVRLLDDLSTVTHSIAAYVSEGSESVEYGTITNKRKLDPAVAARQLYKALSHDGYACIILERHHDTPLNLPEDAPHGGYVVMVDALDTDTGTDEQAICGTIFSVYKRRSPPSLPGRLSDLQQAVGDQVAAGYVVYASATTLHYTLRQGAFSFCLHPVATQYFLQPSTEIRLREGNNDVYADSATLRVDRGLGRAVRQVADAAQPRGTIYDTGCLVANFHGAVSSGGVVLAFGVHLLCDAAPLALIIEQMGGKATDGKGVRILDMAVEDEHVHQTTTFCAGPARVVDAIEAQLLGKSSLKNATEASDE